MKTLGSIFFCFCVFPLIPARSNYPDPQYQVVITEIMVDPGPPVGLPEAEYIELYNRGEFSISLRNWILGFGKHIIILPDVSMAPNQYLIVCDISCAESFSTYGSVLGITNMPAVVNTGQVLTLKTELGILINYIEYSDNWYESSAKAGGGWSLEMIDPDNYCGRAGNWSESVDPKGGTPGSENSVSAINTDIQKPRLLRATLANDSSVILYFSESMDSASYSDRFLYSASRGLLQPIRTDPFEPQYSSIQLTFDRRFSIHERYTVTVLNSMHDCVGNTLEPNASALFGLPEQADSMDIVINEVLFVTAPERGEFIEFFNRSRRVIDMASLTLELTDESTSEVLKQAGMNKNPFLLFPGGFFVIARNAPDIPNQAGTLHPELVLELPALFSLPDKSGCISLTDIDHHCIDRFCYSNSYHSPLLRDVEGISLERSGPDEATNNPENWHSASTLAKYATPGCKNSQLVVPVEENEEILLSTDIFTPDNNGSEDEVALILQFQQPEYSANILVFDASGRKIKTLALNVILGTGSVITWDGTKNDGSPADMGIYIFYIELFNSEGTLKKIRKVVTLARN